MQPIDQEIIYAVKKDKANTFLRLDKPYLMLVTITKYHQQKSDAVWYEYNISRKQK